MMRLFSGTAFFTCSRSSEDSSPNTIRPLHSITKTPSTFLLAIFSCMNSPLKQPQSNPQRPARPHVSLTDKRIACASVLASLQAPRALLTPALSLQVARHSEKSDRPHALL